MKKTISIRMSLRPALTVIMMLCMLSAAAAVFAGAAESWKASFDEICGKVQSADNLTDQELTTLIEKADKLAPEIQKSEDPAKKVYLQRLKKSRNMYQFMLDTRKVAEK